MKGNIVWLASYPKSGNTWFRAFHTSLLDKYNDGLDLDLLQTDYMAGSRFLIDTFTGLDSSCLFSGEAAALRPSVYNAMSRKARRLLLLKVHDAYTFLPDGAPLFPPESSFGTLYIIRNPLDIVPSLMNHFCCGIEKAITLLNDQKFGVHNGQNGLNQLDQSYLDWSGHVLSWVSAADMNVHVIRYEDMIRSPRETFGGAIRFLGIEKTEKDILKAIEQASFENLKRKEREKGFKEKPQHAQSFFRKGQAGSWREYLSEEQAQEIVTKHADVMRRFDYLTDDGKIVY